MKKATLKDRELVISILTDSYVNTPTFQFLMRDNRNPNKYTRRIAEYAFDFGIKRNSVYLSENEKGVAIAFHSDQLTLDFHDIWLQGKLALHAVNLRKFFSIIRHNSYVQKIKDKHKPYIYYWFWAAVKEENQGQSARDLGFSIYKMAKEKKLPIIAETTMKQNKIIYERYGFHVFEEWTNPENGLHVWFLKRDWNQEIRP